MYQRWRIKQIQPRNINFHINRWGRQEKPQPLTKNFQQVQELYLILHVKAGYIKQLLPILNGECLKYVFLNLRKTKLQYKVSMLLTQFLKAAIQVERLHLLLDTNHILRKQFEYKSFMFHLAISLRSMKQTLNFFNLRMQFDWNEVFTNSMLFETIGNFKILQHFYFELEEDHNGNEFCAQNSQNLFQYVSKLSNLVSFSIKFPMNLPDSEEINKEVIKILVNFPLLRNLYINFENIQLKKIRQIDYLNDIVLIQQNLISLTVILNLLNNVWHQSNFTIGQFQEVTSLETLNFIIKHQRERSFTVEPFLKSIQLLHNLSSLNFCLHENNYNPINLNMKGIGSIPKLKFLSVNLHYQALEKICFQSLIRQMRLLQHLQTLQLGFKHEMSEQNTQILCRTLQNYKNLTNFEFRLSQQFEYIQCMDILVQAIKTLKNLKSVKFCNLFEHQKMNSRNYADPIQMFQFASAQLGRLLNLNYLLFEPQLEFYKTAFYIDLNVFFVDLIYRSKRQILKNTNCDVVQSVKNIPVKFSHKQKLFV